MGFVGVFAGAANTPVAATLRRSSCLVLPSEVRPRSPVSSVICVLDIRGFITPKKFVRVSTLHSIDLLCSNTASDFNRHYYYKAREGIYFDRQ